jgi:hypothetical protein
MKTTNYIKLPVKPPFYPYFMEKTHGKSHFSWEKSLVVMDKSIVFMDKSMVFVGHVLVFMDKSHGFQGPFGPAYVSQVRWRPRPGA